ncbi:MAG TPA: phage major capsid protein, partial [Bacillota bacterium]|nr:phage major capsid protein [Bacillota bacterium]
HRGKCESMTAEDLEEAKRDLETKKGLDEKIRALEEELKDAPPANKEVGGMSRNMNTAIEITKENFRDKPAYSNAFFRLLSKPQEVSAEERGVLELGRRTITDMNSGSITSGAAYLLPANTLNDIQSVMVKYGPLYAGVRKLNFPGNVSIPIGTAGAPTNNADGTDTLNFTFTSVDINQAAIVAGIQVPNLLLSNAIDGLPPYLAYEGGKYIGLELEDRILNGVTATHKFEGIITALTATKVEYTEMDWATISAILGAVEAPYGDQATFIMNRKTFFDKFFALEDAEGRPLVNTIPGMTALPGRAPYVIAGRPLILSTKMVDGDVLYYDLDQYIMNISQEPVFESDASYKFGTDDVTYRTKVYAGGKTLFATDAGVYYKLKV